MKFLLLAALILNFSKVMANDLSAVYATKMKEQTFSTSELTKLKSLKVLIVPGVLAESFDSNSGNQIKVGFIFEEGFREQRRLLEKNQINYEYLKFDTESPPTVNAKAIIRAIQNSLVPVVIYSHSKGGLDTLEAFRQRPDLLPKVRGWVSVQSPFWGAPVASLMYDNTLLKDSGKTLFEWMGGDVGGMSALTIPERQSYMESAEIKNLIGDIKKKTKFLNFASFKSNVFGLDTPLELFRNLTQSRAGNNDGVVPLTSALMHSHGYEVDYAIEANVDHLMPMTKYRPDKIDIFHLSRSQYDQQAHTMSLIKMLL
ncbi:hypothetical protein SHI21_14875 [Bacteriovorax sp. PP10]|uniref:Lecithin:cholesterol acyltransferase n=1 Tax=Bacteriovorax antarcticus TaxID=3088717 RepID=A0ABU5VYW8_9BACT|nr:hypothetical protein [Bacteriovorax sp. PP10]MEA9357509.1 hypothetical protein [Bacteriovorax sp. PP10]